MDKSINSISSKLSHKLNYSHINSIANNQTQSHTQLIVTMEDYRNQNSNILSKISDTHLQDESV